MNFSLNNSLKLLTIFLTIVSIASGEQTSRTSRNSRNRSQNHQNRNVRDNHKRQLPLPPQVSSGLPHAVGLTPELTPEHFLSNVASHLQGFDVNLIGPRERVEQTLDEAWNNFKKTFNKVYSTENEEKYRREIFIENTNKIFQMNDDYARGYSSHAQKINGFADMLHHEFEASLNGFNRSMNQDGNLLPTERSTTFIPSANVPIPDSIDWRQLGAVTPVRSQGLCASCYAFSAAGALEGQYFRKTGILHDLSPQNLVDCSKPYGTNGCQGGLINPAFQYVKDNYGIDTEASYPYEAAENQCRYKPEGFGSDCTGYVTIPEGDEEALKIAVSTIGPVAAAIDASRNTLQFYSDGVYFDGNCKNATNDMNHAILVVGYGTDPDGKQFWWVKNSYGPEWGIGGYIKLARNAGNHCGIASLASYPLV